MKFVAGKLILKQALPGYVPAFDSSFKSKT